MSKVATRQSGTTTTSRRPRAPAAASTSNYTSRRAPPASYRVDQVVQNGVATEVITIEDTPPPVAGSSGAGAGGTHASTSGRYDSQSNYEPPPKKRRNDGAHVSDQPYAISSSYRMPPPGTNYESSSQGTARNKRKRDAYDGYANGRDSESGRDLPPRKEHKVAKPQPVSDKDGHYIVRVGDVLDDTLRITRLLGQGTFGKVVCAKNIDNGQEVAVKIIRAVPKYRDASKVEIKVLRKLAQEDPDNRHRCIHLLHTFDYRDHVCIVSELLSASVFDYLKENQYQPFPFNHIQDFARQLLGSVCFLHKHELIHTDLKPENILLESTDSYTVPGKKSKTKKILKSSAIRLIDFGSATFEKEYHANVVSTRHYRAPEIILGMGWSYPCDVWSIGCILIEFYTGEALFQTHENVEHLAMMRRVFGEMPDRFIEAANKHHPEWFIVKSPASRVLDFPIASTTKQSRKFVNQMRSLRDMIPSDTIAAQRFLALLESLLRWEPAKRATVEEALKHPFFSIKIAEDPGLPGAR